MTIDDINLSEEEINNFIAQACGWKYIPNYDPCREGIWTDILGYMHNLCTSYTTSLDSMHEAEKTLTLEERDRYIAALVTGNLFDIITAPPLRKAKAFLIAKKIVWDM